MIVFIDSEGKENIIRSNELVRELITNGTITADTLLKTNINDDEWIKGSDFELYNEIVGTSPQLKKNQDLELDKIEELSVDYTEALQNPDKTEVFKEKWNPIGLTKKTDSKSTLIEHRTNFSKSHFWGIVINEKWYIYPGRGLSVNVAALVADNNSLAHSLFDGIMDITHGEEFFTKEVALAKEKNGVFQIQTLGKIQIPKKSIKPIEETDQIEERKAILKKAKHSKEEIIESSVPSSRLTNESKISKEETYTENESQIVKDITTSNVDETLITKEEEKEVIESSVPKSKPAQQKTEEFQKNTEKNEKTTEDKEEKSKVIKDLKDTSSNEQVKRKAPETNMTLFKSIKTCYKKYFDFNSRASRSEYWFFQLYFAIIYILWFFIFIESFFFLGIIVLLTIIPVISAQVRRLHDTNHSGWWVLAGTVIPFVGFYVLYLLCLKSDNGRNKYGVYPL